MGQSFTVKRVLLSIGGVSSEPGADVFGVVGVELALYEGGGIFGVHSCELSELRRPATDDGLCAAKPEF